MKISLDYNLVAFSEFYDHILPELPGYNLGMVDREIFGSALEFCKMTKLWRESLDDVTTVAGDPILELDPPTTQARFYEVEEIRLDGELLKPITASGAREIDQHWDVAAGDPTNYMMLLDGRLRLYPIPEASDGTINVQGAVLVPSVDATKLPSFLLTQYHDEIAAGALYSLMSMKNKPWTDEKGAQKYLGQSILSTRSEAVRVTKNYTGAPARSRPYFGVK